MEDKNHTIKKKEGVGVVGERKHTVGKGPGLESSFYPSIQVYRASGLELAIRNKMPISLL
jgi:hypothetical protein